MIDQIGAPDGRNSRDPGARRVRIEALRASQRLVPGAVAPNDRDLSIMVVEEDEWCVSYTTLTDVTLAHRLCNNLGYALSALPLDKHATALARWRKRYSSEPPIDLDAAAVAQVEWEAYQTPQSN